jgi:hypothetical protein
MNPTPWKAVRHNPVNVTVQDANGVALATAHQFPPYCDSMETAQLIVEAVNGIKEASLEAAKLRDLVRRLAEYIRRGHCNEVHIDCADPRQSYHVRAADILREAEAALEGKEAQA